MRTVHNFFGQLSYFDKHKIYYCNIVYSILFFFINAGSRISMRSQARNWISNSKNSTDTSLCSTDPSSEIV